MGKIKLGINILRNSIKFVLSENKNNKYYIKGYKIVLIPEDVADRDIYIVDTIKHIIKEKGWKNADINIMCTFCDVNIKGIKIPKIPKEEIRIVVEREAKKFFGDLSEKELVYQIMGEFDQDNKSFYSIFYILISKEIIDKLRDFGIKIYSIDFEIYSLDRIFRKSLSDEKNIMFIDFGHEITRLMLYKNKSLEVYREINIAGKEITSILSGMLGISTDEAEIIKIKYGYVSKKETEDLLLKGEKRARQLNIAYQTVMDKLIRKIVNSIDYFKNQNRGKDVDKIYILGGTAKLKGILDFLKSELLIDAIEYFDIKKFVHFDEKLKKIETESFSFVSPVGSSLIEESIFSFKSKVKKNRFLSENVSKKLTVLFLMGIIPIFVIFAFTKHKEISLKNKLKIIKMKEKEMKKTLDKYLEYESKSFILDQEINKARKLIKVDIDFTRFFYDLNNLVLDNMYLTAIRFENGRAKLAGNAVAKDGFPEIIINQFVDKLGEKYKEVKLLNTNKLRSNSDSDVVASFNIELKILAVREDEIK